MALHVLDNDDPDTRAELLLLSSSFLVPRLVHGGVTVWDTKAIIDRLVVRFPSIEVHNEICLATQERQEAAVLAAEHVDCVVVVGSKRSSNSLRLVQVVQEKRNKPAYLVDTAADLDPEWFRGIARVGVTAGASTPTQITREVIAALEAMPAQTERDPVTSR